MKKLLLLAFFFPLMVVADEPKSSYPPPADVKKAFLKLLDRPKVPLDAKIESLSLKAKTDGLVVEQLTFASEKKPSA